MRHRYEMNQAQTIRDTVADVALMRRTSLANPGLHQAIAAVKRVQSRRFGNTYDDLAVDPRYQAATDFFLTELYGERDYEERDAQFARVAGALQRVLPSEALHTAVSLARLHVLSERLDFAMGEAWLLQGDSMDSPAMRYAACWKSVAQRDLRQVQLDSVLAIGEELGRLTKIAGLRLLLSAMRGPATVAGLTSLQHFLESGFDAFKSLTLRDKGPAKFLDVIRARETHFMNLLFDGTDGAIRAALEGS